MSVNENIIYKYVMTNCIGYGPDMGLGYFLWKS